MDNTIARDFISNATLLLFLSLIYESRHIIPKKMMKLVPYIDGLLISILCAGIMSMPFQLAPGLFFDTRTILIGVTAVMFGSTTTLIAVCATVAYRLALGGAGMWMGSLTIVSSAVIGFAWRHCCAGRIKNRLVSLYLFGFATHIAMLACTFAVPWPLSWQTLQRIALPVMLIFPAATVLLSMLLIWQKERREAAQRLAEAEERYRSMFTNSHAVIMIVDPESGQIADANPAACQFYGWPADKMKNMHLSVISTLTNDKIAENLRQLADEGRNHMLLRQRKANGATADVELYAGPLQINGRRLLYSIIHDVSDRNLAQMEYKALLQAAMDSFCVINSDGKLLDTNDAYCRLSGYSREELMGMSIDDLDVSETPAELAAHLEKVFATGRDRFEARQRCKNGVIVDVEVSCNLIPGSSGRVCAFLRDITDRKKQEDKVVYLSRHDTLTGLYNRAHFEEALRLEDESGKVPLSVITGDINGLKLTNDIFGHADGDNLLRTIASILTKCCRSTDVVARVGGDEFNIFLPNTGMAPAQAICERICRACEASKVTAGGRPIHPSISLGCATKSSADQPIAGILKNAEDSMYKRKLLERKSMHSSLISSIKATMLEKSHETKEHADRLITLCKAIGQNLNLGADQINELELLAALHDIGKIGIDCHILTSPRKLTQEEWQEMKRHPEIGYRIALASPELVSIANCILYHHERWDGNGYPQRLQGNKIPLLARIIAVVDAYDAMTSDRPYRPAMAAADALKELTANSGRQFDPAIVKVFLETIG